MSTISKTNAVVDFLKLMEAYRIPEKNDVALGRNGYLDCPVSTGTYHGIDAQGRVFINIVVSVDGSSEEYEDGVKRQSFIVFQRYTNRSDMFGIGSDDGLYPMGSVAFFKEDAEGSPQFAVLEEILAGKTVTFYGDVSWSESWSGTRTPRIAMTMVR